MLQATLIWLLWQRLLQPFGSAFTRPGHRRFVEWVTALALNVEEHTITQSITAIERVADWKALESFAEYAVWKPEILTGNLSKPIHKAPGRVWHGYRISAVDDTKVHRSGEHVWGTCTFHEYTARCPNRATTVRDHNWVCLGALLQNDGQPAWYLPISGRLYFRKSQLPFRSGVAGPKEVFRTKCELAVELLREQARIASRPHLGVFDGGYALKVAVHTLETP
jgi:DDE superfamily endonuclease